MSKLCIHFQRIPDWFGEFVDRCQGQLEYIVGVDVFPNVPGVKTLGRTYLPDGESGALVDQGASGADEWIDRFAPVYAVNPHVHKWIGPNEYIIWDQNAADRFNAFHVRFIQVMSGLGYGVVCGQINVGWPRLRLFNDPPPYPEALAPTLDALWLHDGLFSLHEYGPGDMRDGVGAHCLRYRNTRAELIAAGITDLPDFIITETGIDVPNPQAPQGHQGWRDFTDWAGYFDQLKWYSSELDKHAYMLGASIFTVADDCWTFQLHREEALPLADWIATDEEEEEEENGMIDIVDLNGNLVEGMTWESVKRDYGLSITEADPPEGAAVFRLVRLVYDSSPETNWRLYVLDEDGRALPGIAAFMGIQPPSGEDLPANAAPRISESFWEQPEGRPNRALVLQPNNLNFTNMDGFIQHSLGSGSNTIPPRPGTHWAWGMPGDGGLFYSDVPAGFGMWDNHKMFWPVFQLVTEGENGNGGNGEDPDLEAVVAQLKRIADAAEEFVSWLKR